MNCNCGSGAVYIDCCEVAHQNIKLVTTAEQLMRSRYTAFTLANGDYLMESHHYTTRPLSEKAEIVAWAKAVEWLRLEVVYSSKGLIGDTEGTVSFRAYYKDRDGVSCIKEHSKFVKENDCWYYLGRV